MIADDIKEKFRAKYDQLHPLMFQRSIEYSGSPGDLFDILDTVPELPYAWDKKSRRWVHLEDLAVVDFPTNQEG
jgi:hypothetical protein